MITRWFQVQHHRDDHPSLMFILFDFQNLLLILWCFDALIYWMPFALILTRRYSKIKRNFRILRHLEMYFTKWILIPKAKTFLFVCKKLKSFLLAKSIFENHKILRLPETNPWNQKALLYLLNLLYLLKLLKNLFVPLKVFIFSIFFDWTTHHLTTNPFDSWVHHKNDFYYEWQNLFDDEPNETHFNNDLFNLDKLFFDDITNHFDNPWN